MNKILLVALLLVGCGDQMERYIDVSSYYTNKVSTFIMEDHRIIIYHGSYGGRMVAIPLSKTEIKK